MELKKKEVALASRTKHVAHFIYRFFGKASHASSAPTEGINAFNAAQLLFHGIDMMRPYLKSGSNINGIIKYGGAAPNIVPELVDVEIMIYAIKGEDLEMLINRVDACAKGASIATQTTWEKRMMKENE